MFWAKSCRRAPAMHAAAEAYLTRLVWPAQTWCRELFVAASEHNWESLGLAEAELQGVARCYKSTKCVEGVQHLR